MNCLYMINAPILFDLTHLSCPHPPFTKISIFGVFVFDFDHNSTTYWTDTTQQRAQLDLSECRPYRHAHNVGLIFSQEKFESVRYPNLMLYSEILSFGGSTF